jgi:co-chaperonin GroES (HSP10)
MQVLGSAVLIKPDKLPERTESGNLVIPKNSEEMLPEWGTVIDAGANCSEVKIGMHIIFPRKSASVIVIDGEDHYFTNEHKIIFMREQSKKRQI